MDEADSLMLMLLMESGQCDVNGEVFEDVDG